jgi:hypothetical protein
LFFVVDVILEDKGSVELVRVVIADASGYELKVAVWSDMARGIVQRGIDGQVLALKHVSVTHKGQYGSDGSMQNDGYVVYDDGSRSDFAQVLDFSFSM